MIIETMMVEMGIQVELLGPTVAVDVVGVPTVAAEGTTVATAVKIPGMMHRDGIQVARREMVMGGAVSLVLRCRIPQAGKHFLVDGVLVAVEVVVTTEAVVVGAGGAVVEVEVVGPAEAGEVAAEAKAKAAAAEVVGPVEVAVAGDKHKMLGGIRMWDARDGF